MAVATMTYRADDPNLLTSMLRGEGVHLDPASILDGLAPDQAGSKPHGLAHSVSEIVAHMCFWQEWFNDCAVKRFTGIARVCHPADGRAQQPSPRSDHHDSSVDEPVAPTRRNADVVTQRQGFPVSALSPGYQYSR